MLAMERGEMRAKGRSGGASAMRGKSAHAEWKRWWLDGGGGARFSTSLIASPPPNDSIPKHIQSAPKPYP